MTSAIMAVVERHIQNESLAEYLEPHFGYPSRTRPCVNDPGSCDYLDGVYWMHDVSMLYSYIMWGVILGILAVWAILRLINPSRRTSVPKAELETQATAYPRGAYYRAWRSVAATRQRYLLPESFTSFFGRVTRIQVLILAIVSGYLLVFSLVAIIYKTYITPVKGTNLFNTRTGIAGFSDRIGVLAYALTPLSVLLSSRESVLSLLTGISYQHFNFLHRWVGRIIFVQSFLHTLVWTVIEGKLYQPQPSVYQTFIAEPYIIWGCFAMLFITFLYVFSLRRVIQWTGYEFFKKSHYVVASLYIGACWGHWDKLYFWVLASLIVVLLDLGLRILGIGLNHIGYTTSGSIGFTPAPATLRTFGTGPDTVIRIDFSHPSPAWKPGQHYYLCFPALSIWQSHPFTPPPAQHRTTPTSSARSPARHPASQNLLEKSRAQLRLSSSQARISFSLPLVLEAAGSEAHKAGLVQLVWVVRRARDLAWVKEELGVLRARAAEGRVEVRIFVTREGGPMEGDGEEVVMVDGGKEVEVEKMVAVVDVDDENPQNTEASLDVSALARESRGFSVTYLDGAHPDLGTVVDDYIERSPASGGRIQVMASGPAGIGSALRSAVGKCNDGRKVGRGDEKSDVGLYWDDRFL
ncbi:hypothetical protein V502_10504 [Pseudogymnoascus sp. VKM F-4520 (FW-2644)]|nr:hypothetical protein V502_10504 [Pseudogymnoascus sp. VKM F-4520 (FW-2644)]